MELRGYLCDSVLIFFLCLVGDVFKMFDDLYLISEYNISEYLYVLYLKFERL
jgi:hypothetical protein